MPNTFDSLTFLKSDRDGTDKDECKGVVFRATTNMFMQGETIRSSRQLKMLRRDSCSGCEKCGWILEYLQEEIYYLKDDAVDLLDDIQDGKKYTPKFNSSQDWESGIWEIDDVEFIEVVDETK